MFERIYGLEHDPWRCESSASERAKYRHTLAALGGRRYSRALEVGCGIGVFTLDLALRCDAVVALEPSATALSRARRRLRFARHVRVVQGAIPDDLPAGPFDLVVCSEVLYYLREPLVLEALAELEQRIVPGGTLIAVHYAPSLGSRMIARLNLLHRAPRPYAPISGRRVHELLRANTRLAHMHEERHRAYLLDRFDDRRV
jgi:SAM-dependent methyltransferase